MEKLKNLISYCPETGDFTWKKDRTRKGLVFRKAGDPAGCLSKATGYIVIRVEGVNYLAHRIAWFLLTGESPPTVDHINGVRNDNRFVNLRAATKKQNVRNRHSTKGVHKAKGRAKWTAYITVDYRRIHLGQFDTEQEASAVYQKAAEDHFGQFARAI